jgi:hypothetical protein
MEILFYLCVVYCAFNLGGFHAKIQLHQQQLAQKPKGKNGVLLIEKINEQYYGYLDDNFIGQGAKPEELTKIVSDLMKKDPDRYSSVVVVSKEV